MARGRPRNPASPSGERSPGTRGRRAQAQVPFSHKLVLNRWLLSLLGVERFEDLAETLRTGASEGLDGDNVHHFHHALTGRLFNETRLSDEELLAYDRNIVAHTLRLNERRLAHGEDPIVWKYFQYLALLFTEIYLDRYFRDPDALRTALNEEIASYNEGKPDADRVDPLDAEAEAWPQLNKISLWMATGSGKTLVMHANVLQYQHYLGLHGRRRDLNRILLLTPNEGLSRQHLREFATSGIQAELFDKDGRGLFTSQSVEILEVTKLRDDMGDRTVAVEAFEGNNLVLVDEGHRGASGGGEGAWMRHRNALCERGFSFEYSATFGQAVKGSPVLAQAYARNILFDYSYRYFYKDGFGKDYQILNLDEATERDDLELYLVACLLSFFQQQRLYQEHGGALRPFQLERPLWIFVGGSVTASLATRDASDIVEILSFLARFVADRRGSIERIGRILNQGLVTANGRDLFAGRFVYLNTSGLGPAQIFEEILRSVFNAPAGGQLYVQNLKGATGEIALRLGVENEPFGLINVGDDARLVRLCETRGLATGDLEFAGSLFDALSKEDSAIHLLIGSKKFTEGWSSWRVSTLGLMNVGRGEGAQIIQLFGRGVRLKGFGKSLKRSGRAQLPEGLQAPRHIGLLETLGVFGIRASYMAQFRDFLEEEGLPANEDRLEFLLPVIKGLGTQRLRTLRLKDTIQGVSTQFGDAFRRLGPIPTLGPPDPDGEPDTQYLHRNQVVLNWYPKIQAMRSTGLHGGDSEAAPNEASLGAGHMAFLDLDRLHFELERFKAERGWYNLNLTRAGIAALLADPSWYRLLIPGESLAFDSFERVQTWQQIALALLKKYTEHYYRFRKRQWELPHLEYRDLEETDPNLLGVGESPDDAYYRVLIDRSQEEIVAKLSELETIIRSGELKPWAFRALKAVWFGQHLYQPLLYLDGKLSESLVEITPQPLNKGERQFVEDLAAFHDSNPDFFERRELYLLRNLSRGRGVGFFEAGNFHPDFILWLLEGDAQHVVFVDPKGLRNIGPTDPKVQFHDTVKEIEERLGDSSMHLHSFIVSNTPSAALRMLWGSMTKAQMQALHILFQEEDRPNYVRDLLQRVLESGSTATGGPRSQ